MVPTQYRVKSSRAAKARPGIVRQNPLEAGSTAPQHLLMTKRSPFRYFKTSPEFIRVAVMLYVRFPLSPRNVEDTLHERGIAGQDGTAV